MVRLRKTFTLVFWKTLSRPRDFENVGVPAFAGASVIVGRGIEVVQAQVHSPLDEVVIVGADVVASHAHGGNHEAGAAEPR